MNRINHFREYWPSYILLLSVIISSGVIFKKHRTVSRIQTQMSRVSHIDGNSFDDHSTISAVKNLTLDSFIENSGIVNRKGHVLHSFFNVPCHQEIEGPITFFDYYQNKNNLQSIYEDCFYTRSPPFTEYFYKAVSSSFKVNNLRNISLIISVLNVFLLFLIIRSYFSFKVSVLTISLYILSYSSYGWVQNLYNIPIQEGLLSIFILTLVRSFKYRRIVYFLAPFLIVYTSNEYLFYTLCIGGYFLLIKKKSIKDLSLVCLGVGLSLSLYLIQRVMFFGSLEKVIGDVSNTLTNRYPLVNDSFFDSLELMSKYIYMTLNYNVISVALIIVSLIVLMLKRKSSEVRDILVFLAGSLLFSMILFNVALYHTHIFFRHFILTFLLSLGFVFRELLNKNNKIVLRLIILLAIVWQIGISLKRVSVEYRMIFAGEEKIFENNITNQLKDLLIWSESKTSVEHGQRHLLVNNITPGNKYFTPRVFKIKGNERFIFDYYFIDKVVANEFWILVLNEQQLSSLSKCQIYSKKNSIIELNIAISSKEESTLLKGLYWKKFLFENTLTDFIRLDCRSGDSIDVFETMIFGEKNESE
ncbi:hypothetical protein [Halobacteriovorax sp. HLS]|uniref:hypothetical protein n=1 Tax=Halobacteriovorax sp. HLS TaxID=2234000 RepID=UPI000FDB9008|nr:hypothetical protein [Halobacteriovorax sp. HLS]